MINIFSKLFPKKWIKTVGRIPAQYIPLIIKLCLFPGHLLITSLIWKSIIQRLPPADLNALGIFLSLQFIATVFLLGSHTDLGNSIIDAQDVQEKFIFSLVIHIPIIIMLFPILLNQANSILAVLGLDTSYKLLLATWLITMMVVAPVTAFNVVFTSKSKTHIFAILQLFSTFVTFLIVTLYLAKLDLANPVSYLLAFAFGNLVFMILCLFYILKYFHFSLASPIFIFKKNFLSRINWGSLFLSIIGPLALTMDRVLISLFGNDREIITINAVNKISIASMVLVTFIISGFIPQIARSTSMMALRKIYFPIFTICALLVITIASFLRSYVTFVTSGRISIPGSLVISFVIFLMVYTISSSINVHLRTRSDQIFLVITSACSLPITFFLASRFIPSYGVSGLYAAFAVSLILSSLIPSFIRLRFKIKVR